MQCSLCVYRFVYRFVFSLVFRFVFRVDSFKVIFNRYELQLERIRNRPLEVHAQFEAELQQMEEQRRREHEERAQREAELEQERQRARERRMDRIRERGRGNESETDSEMGERTRVVEHAAAMGNSAEIQAVEEDPELAGEYLKRSLQSILDEVSGSRSGSEVSAEDWD